MMPMDKWFLIRRCDVFNRLSVERPEKERVVGNYLMRCERRRPINPAATVFPFSLGVFFA
jgi:hypothetical protein